MATALPPTSAPKHPGPCAADVGLPCRVCERSRAPDFRRALAIMADPTDCLHRGAATGELAVCTECKGTRLKVFACAVHGTCTLERPGVGVGGKCKGCAERTVVPVPELLPGLADPLPVPEISRPPANWANLPAVQARHAAALQALAARLAQADQLQAARVACAAGAAALVPPLPSPSADGDACRGRGHASPRSTGDASPPGAGDGIVICGGGRYWPMIALAVRMAREATELPIQLWHRGAEEPVEPADLAGVPGISFHDASAYHCRISGGWETKGLALLHCGLARVLYMDADAYLVADPRPLLEAATPATPFVFWQDLPAQLGRIRWPGWGMADPKIPPVQGGQLAIHRAGAWRCLVVFHWANQHSDYFYKHGFGDQDCWPPALAATGTPWRCLGQSPWQSPAYVLPWEGAPLIVHRCRGKLYGTSHDKYEPALPAEPRLWEHRARMLDARKPVPAASDWRAARLRALAREERCDAPGGGLAGNRVGGLLELIEYVQSLHTAGARRPLRVLEIGSYKGVSSEAFALTCAALTCIDPWPDETTLAAFRRRMGGYPHVAVIRGSSPAALTAIEPAAFDLVYIDATHAARELTADARAAWRVVRPGGWIAGHDFGGPLEEVTTTVRRLFGEPRVFADSSWLVRRPDTLPEVTP